MRPGAALLRGVLALLLAALPLQAALAHKIKVFATAEGRTIEGYVYFPGGGRGRNLQVLFLGPDGARLGETATDADGRFRYEAASAVDHRMVVDSGDGHRGEYVVSAAELGGAPPAGAGAAPATAAARNAPEAPAGTADAALEQLVDRAVARHVRPLREQLEAYEEKVRLHDVLGGLGWILGLFGLAAWLHARR